MIIKVSFFWVSLKRKSKQQSKNKKNLNSPQKRHKILLSLQIDRNKYEDYTLILLSN